MHPDILQISKLSLFNGIDTGELIDIFEESRFIYSSYEPGRVIKFRGEKIEDLMILLYGDVKTEMVDFNGKAVQVEKLQAPFILASGFLFAQNNSLPVDITAVSKATLISMKKQRVTEMCIKHKKILDNLLTDIGNRMEFLSEKLWLSTLKSLKEKFCFYILRLYNQQKTNPVILTDTLEEISAVMGVARPSLSRVIIEMEEEGLLKKSNNSIFILDKDKMNFYFQ